MKLRVTDISTDESVRVLADRLQSSFHTIEEFPSIAASLEAAGLSLRKNSRQGWLPRLWLHFSVLVERWNSANSNEAIIRTYDQQYRRGVYGYASALLSLEGFLRITGIPHSSLHSLTIFDVGAGSNEFLKFCKDSLQIPATRLHAVDVSAESTRLIASEGFLAYTGTLRDVKKSLDRYDVLYLSYFIDYDTDQEGTFRSAVELARPGAKIVLEGQFPVHPFALLSSDGAKYSFITDGESVEGDIEKVVNSFVQFGKESGRRIVCAQILMAHRFVSSQYGFNRLPACFITFDVLD